MTYIFTVNPDGTTTVDVDFSDEGVNLQGSINVEGEEGQALSYLPIFEEDLRRNFAELFPIPEMPPGGEF